jgi:hypothetical protein
MGLAGAVGVAGAAGSDRTIQRFLVPIHQLLDCRVLRAAGRGFQ